MRRRVENKSEKGMQSVVKNKKSVAIMLVLILAVLVTLVASNQEVRESIIQAFNGEIQNAEENEEVEVYDDGSILLTDDSAIVSSLAIINKTTGTGPFDENDEPGNDSSSANNIVRSFDTVTYEIEANMAVNNTEHGSADANTYASFRGGIINVEATIPEENAGTMKWSVDDMAWANGTGVLSEDGLTFTAQYKMDDGKITVPGKQTISLVLKVEGAANGTQLAPRFKVWMQGNETNSENEGYEVVEVVEDEPITISAKGSFNIKFLKGSRFTPKATVNFEDGAGEVTGRIYGYGAILQLYNEDKEKGLKGLEYPKGDITFDIQTKLEAVETIDGKQVTTDITDLATPRLWNYKINVGNVSENPAYGNIQDRNMYFGGYTSYDDGSMPYGILRAGRASDSIYNSGDILMQEDRNIIHTTINDYEFNGVFPIYNDYHDSATSIIYGENVGCFSAGFFQIFVPDNEETLKDNRTYYLTVEDKNMQVETVSNQKVTNQVITNDDTNRIQHFTLKPGGYNHSISIYNDQNKYIYETTLGKARISKGQNIQPYLYIAQNSDNDIGTEIKSVNKLVKFNGDGLEPILYEDGEKAHFSHDIMTWKIWYVTKKDGTNWVDETERNNANIEDLNMYENLEDIPEGYICIGMYFESQSGMIQRGINFNIKIRLKIKETAQIGKTYGIMQDDDYWLETLDRTTQTATNPNAEYPRTVWSAHNQQYKQTQYDENGQIILGTHYANRRWGNTVLILGADSSISVQAINPDTQQEKTVYDIGKNENIVTLKMTPTLTEIDPQVPTNIKGTTVRIKETLPKELTYIPGSSNYGEPIEKIEVEDGTTYIWEIYNCNVGEKIEDLVIKAEINPDTKNGTTLQVTSIIEPDKDIIGLSSIELRTDTRGIQIVNLSSHSLYKETEDRIIETNGEIKYKVTYQNKTDYSMPEFQLLDILPYNGDGRKTAYNGTYILENVNIVQTAEGSTTPNYNLTLYTTTDIEARKITPKDEGIGITEDQGGIWKEKEIGKAIDEPVTVLAVKGQISPNTKVEMEITLKTNNNRAEDIYSNSATAQTSKNTEVITSTNTETRVVRRQISGMIWYDTNENGIKDENESYANRVEVELKKSDGSKAVDINGNEVPNVLTDNNGKYEFNNLPRDEYIVQIQTAEIYTLTKANVGSNREINSKFVIGPNGEKQSYTITSLNGIQSPEITEKNVNAGLVVKDAKIIVKYLEEDKTPETDADNKLLKEQDEFTTYEKDGVQTKYKLGDTYNTEPAEITDYITLRNSGNTSGRLNEEVVVVTYYYTCNKQDINVQKVWNDNNDQAKKRPTSIKIKLKDGNTTVAEQVLSATNKTEDNENIWATTFTDITTYRENGEKITYSVDEEENEGTLDSYVKTLKGTTITNTFTQNTERTQVQVIKNWEDNDDYAGKRPDNLVLILKKEVSTEEGKTETQEVARATINAEDNKGSNNNEWVYTFTNLAKYDENNNEIKYVVEEEKPVFYEEYVQKTAENTYEITNTFAVPTETFDLEVTKIWNDNNNRAGKRPEKVTLVLTGKNARGEVITEEKKITLTSENKVGEDITEENVWKGTITGLPKYDLNADIINYELSEENLNNIFYTTENVTIDQQTKTVTNRFEVPDDKVEITVNKKWDDNNNELERRPEEVTLYLSGNNKEYDIKLTEANKTADESIWSGTISNLPKYDVNGDEITYTLDERPIANEFYTKTGIDQTAKTVINKFGIPTETIQVPVTKIWEDSNNKAGKRPENIVLQIKDKKTGEVELEQLVQGNKTTNDGWSYIFEVPKYNETGEEVEYEIGERNLNNKFYPSASTKIDQEQRTITNVFAIPDEKIELIVNKVWNDNETQSNRRPETIVINVKATNGENNNPEETIATYELNTKTETSHTFTNLPKYNSQGKEIVYRVEEQEKTVGDLKFYTSNVSEVINVENEENKKQATITNTFIRPTETIQMTITKIWEDEGNRYEKRPESIHVEIKNGDVVVKEQEVAGEDGTNTWTYTFTGLDKYDVNGEEIEYTVDEKELVGEAQLYYTKEITGTTITNRMTRVPGTVTVKYIDKYTGEEIDDRVEKDGVIGTKYDVTEDKKEIAGYTLIEEPEEKEGIYTEEPQEKIYYYAKNTNVIVKYLEKDETESNADNTVVAEEVRIEGYEGKEYTTEEKTVPNYTFVEVDGETEGNMTSESIEVIYYYAPNTKVMVKYLEQDNTPENNEDNILLATEEIEGYAGKEYTTEEKVIEGYTFVKATENTKGIMTKDTIEVIYYYAPNTKVIVKYLEQDNTPENNNDNKVLKPETTIEGYVGKEYTTKEEVIKGYTFVEATENTKGTMTKDTIEVIYYYAQNTKLTVQHIDRETGEILKEEIETGKVGDIVETKAEAFEGYVLVESPEEPNVILDETGEQIVKYYYAHISEGVIEKHIDVITGELLYSEEHKGNEGDSYTILSKEFEGYDLVESKLPENAEGEMTKEIIEVNYYYIKKASVRVQYLEKDDTPNDDTDNKVIAKEEIINGHENDNYETKAKEINNYVLVETPENATGKMEVKINEDGSYETETIVRYYYVKQAGGVIEKHIDIDSGEILEEEKHEGKVGDKYEIPAREIEGYVLVKEDEEGNSKLPTNAKGEMTEEGIEVIYYYEKLATVKVEYIDKYTGEIIEEEKIEGCVGEEYETTEKEFEGYDLVEKPTNSKGEMTKEEIVVKYYYLRKTEVEIQYIEKETGYMIAEAERIEGHEGEKYETTEKEIEYYDFIEKTENYKGEMTREKIIVTYYYEKKTFNLAIDKWISGASIDGVAQIGQSYGTRDELYKIDIHRKRTETANVKVTYKIRVTNTGEIEGTASKITEVIPEGFSYQEEDNKINWKTENGIIVTDVLKDETIKPGESKEIEIVLRWNKGEGNFGEKRNTVIISGVTNPAKYVDMNEEDNSDKSEMLMTIETGGLDSRDRTIVAIVSVQGLIVVAVGILFRRKTKKQKRNHHIQ